MGDDTWPKWWSPEGRKKDDPERSVKGSEIGDKGEESTI
jgi:hypothetical protein